jgi:hypothetical protein
VSKAPTLGIPNHFRLEQTVPAMCIDTSLRSSGRMANHFKLKPSNFEPISMDGFWCRFLWELNGGLCCRGEVINRLWGIML